MKRFSRIIRPKEAHSCNLYKCRLWKIDWILDI